MKEPNVDNLNDLSLVDLFRMEVETQSKVLTDGLLGLETETDQKRWLKELMRAAHSLKGAARIVGRKSAVRIAHAMEECFVAAQNEKLAISGNVVDALLKGTDYLGRIAQVSEDGFQSWELGQRPEIEAFLTSLDHLNEAVNLPLLAAPSVISPLPPVAVLAPPNENIKDENIKDENVKDLTPAIPDASAEPIVQSADQALRVTVENLNRLMGLAGEAMMASRWLETFAADMARLKHLQRQLSDGIDVIRDLAASADAGRPASVKWVGIRDGISDCQQSLGERLAELDQFDRRLLNFSKRLYHEVLDCRMRPFAEGVQGLRRMVRDVARLLDKQVTLEITGEATLVDRGVLERIKAPLDHLLRNAIDHGIESPALRQQSGKSPTGTLRLEAAHRGGMLLISLADDGAGVDIEAVRHAVVAKNLTTIETTQNMSETELLEFLFLPGFTLKQAVSEISGRGVGLDVVQSMVKTVGGLVRIFSQSGRGTRFQLELPLTLSVVRTLVVEIGGEPYALPLARIGRAIKLSREQIEVVQGRQHFALDGEHVGLVAAHQALNLEQGPAQTGDVSVLVLGDADARYGLVIDRFLGERELVVRNLDARLGKVKNVSSAALMPDGSPVFIIDVDDLKRSIENLISGKQLEQVEAEAGPQTARVRKRVLVVDDSLTVRELERQLLAARGYAVDVAVDGMDGWNAIRAGQYDLVVTDVDMPRLDGIEMLKLIRKDSRLKSLPVAIVSYKDRQEDRTRGMEAGADYYLTKASFHDETLLRVVADLIGSAHA